MPPPEIYMLVLRVEMPAVMFIVIMQSMTINFPKVKRLLV